LPEAASLVLFLAQMKTLILRRTAELSSLEAGIMDIGKGPT
jgi:hypothetical protein